MGFFDLNGAIGRKFGSIGLSLENPSMQLRMQISDQMHITYAADKADGLVEKTKSILAQLRAAWGITQNISLDFEQTLPQHAGLGSGTQLALSVGTAMCRLFDLPYSTAEIALATNRGGRSGIGIAAFDTGGLLIDGGRSQTVNKTSIPPLLARYAFPDDWAILLISEASHTGVHGKAEQSAFKELPTFPQEDAAMLCHEVLMKAMPAVVEHDLQAFGETVQKLQSVTGDHFAPVQGGRYASQQVSKVLAYLAESGNACYGQSSWGPTGFAVFSSMKQAKQQLDILQQTFAELPVSYLLTKADNRGARITVETSV